MIEDNRNARYTKNVNILQSDFRVGNSNIEQRLFENFQSEMPWISGTHHQSAPKAFS